MNTLSQDFIGQDVAVVLQGTMPVTILGKLEAADQHFLRVQQRNERGSMLIPLGSVLHITSAAPVGEDD